MTLVEALAADTAAIFFMVELQFSSSTAYFTDTDIDVFYDSNWYQSHPFTIGSPVLSADMAVDNVTFEFSNVGLEFASYLLTGDPAGTLTILSYVAFDSSYQIIGVGNLFRGYIDEWKLEDQKASIMICNEFIFWRKKSLRKCQSSCKWILAGTECGYSGSESLCNQTFPRCKELSKEDSFGGFRFLPSIQNKEIWWGRIPSR